MSSDLIDPGDAFGTAWWPWINRVNPSDLDLWAWDRGDDIRNLAKDIKVQGGLRSEEMLAVSDDEDCFVLLKALDTALADCHPRVGPNYGALAPVAARAVRTGRFSTDGSPVTVLPRWSIPCRPGLGVSRANDAFSSVTCIPAHLLDKVEIRRPHPLDDLDRSHNFGQRHIKFVFVPAMDSLDDVVLEKGVGLPGRPEDSWYRVIPNESRMAERIPRLIQVLDASGADIAVLPEACLSPALLDVWQEALAGTPPAFDSPLRWIVVGSGPFAPLQMGDARPTNTAKLLVRSTGEEILEHSKFAPFNFGAGQATDWGLSELELVTPPIHEGIRQGSGIQALASHVGRFCLLVCEDVTRSGEPMADLVVDLAPSHLLVPVFGKDIKQWYWEDQASRRHATLFGISVAIGNSLVVSRAIGAKDPASALYVEAHDDPSVWLPSSASRLGLATSAIDGVVLP